MALFGRMLAAGFAGIGEGLGEAAEAQDARIAEERARRDKLMQQALIFAKNDKDKWQAAKQNKQDLVANINSRLAPYADKFGSDQERLLAAASIAKTYTSPDAAKQYLDRLEANFEQDADIDFEFASKIDPKVLQAISLDSISSSLVPAYLKPKDWDTYYSPAEYQTESLLFRSDKTPASLTRQSEEARKLGEAAGLTGEYDTSVEIPSVGLPALERISRTQSEQERYERLNSLLYNLEKQGDAPPERLEKLRAETAAARQAAIKYAADLSLAKQQSPSVVTTDATLRLINNVDKDGGVQSVYAGSPPMRQLYSAVVGMPVSEEAKKAAKQETVFEIYRAAKTFFEQRNESIPDKDVARLAIGATGIINIDEVKGQPEAVSIIEADRIRLGQTGDYRNLMDYLRSIKPDSPEYAEISVAPDLSSHKFLVDIFNKQEKKEPLTTQDRVYMTRAFKVIMARGYFVPNKFLSTLNFATLFQEEFGMNPIHKMPNVNEPY